MNKIILSVLIFSILISPAFCQEGQGVADSLRVPVEADSLRIARMDSIRFAQEDSIRLLRAQEGYVPLWESDTSYDVRGSDSIVVYQKSPMVQADSLVLVEPDFSHSPSRAIMLALVLPGLGQAYNKKYYKMPIVWAALGGAGYAITYNTRNYKQASQDYAQTPDDLNEHALQFWRRNMELSYIALIVVYALQVVDAYVDAQLYSWDVNDNLSLRVAPSLQPLMSPKSLTGQAYGLTCSFDLKRK